MSDDVETIDRPLTDVGKTRRSLKVLFLPAWYPSRENPVNAVFVREHARAASLYNEVVVLYVCADETKPPWKRCQTTEEVEDGIRTVRVNYGTYWPIAAPLKRRVFRRQLGNWARDPSPTKGGGLLRPIKALLTIGGIVVGDLLYCRSTFVSFRKLLKSGWRPDVIHAHVFTAGVPAVILGRLYRIPVVITEHWTAIPLRLLTLSQRSKIRFAMNRARAVLPVSRSLKEAIQSYGIRNQFHVVPNAVDDGVFLVGGPREELSTVGRKSILLVTRLVPQKGVSYLLEALAKVKTARSDFVLHIIGDGPDRRNYEEQSERLGLAGVVTFHGSMVKPAVAQFMRDCDFFAQSSLVETFGVVYIEAMACGKPVIASNIPGPNEFINDEVGVLVPPGDVTALARAIDFMLDHHADYSSEKTAQYARDRFSHEAVGRMLDQVYARVVAEAPWAGHC